MIDSILDEKYPAAEELLGEMELRCTFKDVTWESLNDADFFAAIRRQFPDENLSRLYTMLNTIAERDRAAVRKHEPPKDEEWPETLF